MASPELLNLPIDLWIGIISAIVSALIVGFGKVWISMRKLRAEEKERAEDRESQRKATEELQVKIKEAEERLYKQLRDEVHERRNQAQTLLTQNEILSKSLSGLQDQLTVARNDIQARDRTIERLRAIIERLRRTVARYHPGGDEGILDDDETDPVTSTKK